jgi:hypothetical protein
VSEQSAEKDAPFVMPGEGWLARTLCGWHDAESGRAPGEEFPCAYCVVLAEYVVDQARDAQSFTPSSAATLAASLKAAFARVTPPEGSDAACANCGHRYGRHTLADCQEMIPHHGYESSCNCPGWASVLPPGSTGTEADS